jgi:hypothetical protein
MFFSRFKYHMFYVLYPLVTYLLTPSYDTIFPASNTVPSSNGGTENRVFPNMFHDVQGLREVKKFLNWCHKRRSSLWD